MSFRKALKYKNNSETLDEKIAEANKEYQKTGTVAPQMMTICTICTSSGTRHLPEIVWYQDGSRGDSTRQLEQVQQETRALVKR